MTDDVVNNKDLHFKGQYAGEYVMAFFRRHWTTLIPHIMVSGFFLALLAALFVTFSGLIVPFLLSGIGQIILPVAVVLLTYCIHNFFIRFVDHFLHITIITNLRIVQAEKIIFIKDQQISFDMNVIQDIKKEQNGLWKNILNVGEVVIMMSSSDVHVIKFVPNPNFHFRLINRAKIGYGQEHLQDSTKNRQHQPIVQKNTFIPEKFFKIHQALPPS
jgi:hypothetical protein